jgi:hypothetical protein
LNIAVSYEALKEFVPEFGHALRETESILAEPPSDYIGHLCDAAAHLPLLDNPAADRLADDPAIHRATAAVVIPKPVDKIY